MLEIKALNKQKKIWGWIMSIPAIISILVFIIYPIIFSITLSFTGIRANITNVKWNNFENYKWLFSEEGKEFWSGLWVSFKFSIISTIIQTILGFLLAYLLYNMSKKTQSIYRVLLYVPCILPGAVVSIMWRFIYQYDVGLLHKIFVSLSLEPVKWLTDPKVVLFSIIIANTWRFVGITMVLYFVNMNAISKDILEGAVIDGANKFTILIRFIFPLTFSATKMNLILSFIGGMKTFDLFFFLTNGQIREANPVGWIIYRMAFKDNRMGWAIVMSVLLTIVLSVFTYISNHYLGKIEDNYE